MMALVLVLAALCGAAPKSKLTLAPGHERWPRVTILERVSASVPPGFDRELAPIGARAAMLTLTDGTDTVVVTVYGDGAPDALRVHREELQKALGGGAATTTKRRFIGKKRTAETIAATYRGVNVVGEVVAADLGARTIVASIVRVADGPNQLVLETVVSLVAVE